jgi:hypothetical protein
MKSTELKSEAILFQIINLFHMDFFMARRRRLKWEREGDGEKISMRLRKTRSPMLFERDLISSIVR